VRLIAEVIRISHAKFHCNRLTLTTVQDIQDYASLIVEKLKHCPYKTASDILVSRFVASDNLDVT